MTRVVMADTLGPIENYSLRSIDLPPPGPGQVRVAIKAAGVSFVDVLVAAGRYQVRPDVPFIPGSECAGVVEAVGEGVDRFAPGDRVTATGWQGIFAEASNMAATALTPMPDGYSFAEAATYAVSTYTSWYGLVDRGQLKAGETLLVLGAGGATGYAAVQIGRHLGARVIASASSADKRAIALEAGADATVEARAEDWRDQVRAANGGRAVDVVFDPVGGAATEPAFRMLAPGGRHLVVGFAGGMTSLPTNLALLKSASLVGVNIGALADADMGLAEANRRTLLDLAGRGLFRPKIARTYRLEDFADAMRHAAQGDSAGRIVIATD